MRMLRNLRLDNILCAEEVSSYGKKQKIMPFSSLSQGFNGETTHPVQSRYAVVFAASVGKVIATEASFDKGGLAWPMVNLPTILR